MNADEYERKLRDAVCETTEQFRHANPYPPEATQEHLRVLRVAHHAALTAYADWLRLRAVAGQPCYRRWFNNHLGEMVDCAYVEQRSGGHWVEENRCPPCAAQQKIAEILAAAEGSTG